MIISIFPPSRGDVLPFDTPFALQQDNWNDYHFQTLYHLYRRQPSVGEKPTLIGAVKILRRGQTESDGIQIQQPFERLSDSFCSIGTSLDYYQRLNEISLAERDEILDALRDVVSMPDLQPTFRAERGWAKSLFRDDPNPDEFLSDARAILTGNFAALPDLHLDLSFHPAGWPTPIRLDFDSPNSWTLGLFPTPRGRDTVLPRRIL